MSGKIRFGFLMIILLLLLVVGQGAVLAAGSSQGTWSDSPALVSSHTSVQPVADKSHCVATVEPIRSGETSSHITATRCFDNFRDFAVALTQGELVVPEGASNNSIRDDLDAYLTARANSIQNDPDAYSTQGVLTIYVVSIFYDWTNYQNSSYALESGVAGCGAGYTYGFQNLVGIGWNDQAESVKNYLCNSSTWYQDTNYNNWTYSGSLYWCNASQCSSLSLMNNQASSARWTN